jgi:hypothetical protein
MGLRKRLSRLFSWADERFEFVITLERLRFHAQELLNAHTSYPDFLKPVTGYLIIVFGLLSLVPKLFQSQGAEEEFVSLDLSSEPLQHAKWRTPTTFCTELHYFAELIEHAAKSGQGDLEPMDCYICPQRGKQLIPPVGNVLEKLAQSAAEHRIVIRYFFLFEKEEYDALDAESLAQFLRGYAFGDTAYILLDDSLRKRYGVPHLSRFNCVAFANQKVFFSHNRNQSGQFIRARKFTGESAERRIKVMARLKIMAKNL